MSKKINRDDIDRFHDYGIYIPKRTIYTSSETYNVDGQESGVDGFMAERFIKNLSILEGINSDPITVIMNSLGGNWYHGIAIYDAIKNAKSHITIIVHGMAMSMGSIILQAADERILQPNATIMVHDGNEWFSGTPKSFEAWGDQSKYTRHKMYEIYAESSGKSASYWEKRCRADYILTAEAAIEEGLADKLSNSVDEKNE